MRRITLLCGMLACVMGLSACMPCYDGTQQYGTFTQYRACPRGLAIKHCHDSEANARNCECSQQCPCWRRHK